MAECDIGLSGRLQCSGPVKPFDDLGRQDMEWYRERIQLIPLR